MAITISGTGCILMDHIYNNIDFTADAFGKYLSESPGDGGLTPGKLVFTNDFENFTNGDFNTVLPEITGDRGPDGVNLGGPAIVALVHCTQLLWDQNIEVNFFGTCGKDSTGDEILKTLSATDVDVRNLKTVEGDSPSTTVLSDPWFSHGRGERLFINRIGSAWNYTPEDLGEDFFSGDILFFGGTALVPVIHENLTDLLKKGKLMGRITVVTTVYDFLNERSNPGKPWPLGSGDESFPLIDLFIADKEESLRISGQNDIPSAIRWFAMKGAASVIITNGVADIYLFSCGTLFAEQRITTLPVSRRISNDLDTEERVIGDTTGCGDNFAGGVLASLAVQLERSPEKPPNIIEACAWGIISGGYTCFYFGGTYSEKTPGEKQNMIKPYYNDYCTQINLADHSKTNSETIKDNKC